MSINLFSAEYAAALDQNDPLARFASDFHHPQDKAGNPLRYFCGNSLGLQPKRAAQLLQEELADWAEFAVEGHSEARRPWKDYHEFFAPQLSKIVGAKPHELVVANTLTTNLHLLMVSFYRPTKKRYKILIEASAFPSDQYAVASQLRFHGFDAKQGLIEWKPRAGDAILHLEDLEHILTEQGEEIALMLIGGVNYYTGQAFNLQAIGALAKKHEIALGFDLAHAAGNIPLNLSESGADFAAWCHYKYLNAGPGAIAGLFVAEKHHGREDIPRFEGWWGHDKASRFAMPAQYQSMGTAESWQLSNVPVFSLTPLLASLQIFEEAGGMPALRRKSEELSQYLYDGLALLGLPVLSPKDMKDRGCQVSLQADKKLFAALQAQGIICDWREPDVIRLAPVPLYNHFADVQAFLKTLQTSLGKN